MKNKVTNIFTYALKQRNAGNYKTVEQKFHLDHLIKQGHKQAKQIKPKQRIKKCKI